MDAPRQLAETAHGAPPRAAKAWTGAGGRHWAAGRRARSRRSTRRWNRRTTRPPAHFSTTQLGIVPQQAAAAGALEQLALGLRARGAPGFTAGLPADRPATEAARKLWRDSWPRCRRTCGAGWRAGRASSRAATQLSFAHGKVWGTSWPEFALVPAPDVLPAGADALADWALFETRLEVMERAAHRFTVLVPSSGPLAEEQALARHGNGRSVVRLEKPAHGVRRAPYWAMFRTGYARRDWTRCWGRAAARPRWRHN